MKMKVSSLKFYQKEGFSQTETNFCQPSGKVFCSSLKRVLKEISCLLLLISCWPRYSRPPIFYLLHTPYALRLNNTRRFSTADNQKLINFIQKKITNKILNVSLLWDKKNINAQKQFVARQQEQSTFAHGMRESSSLHLIFRAQNLVFPSCSRKKVLLQCLFLKRTALALAF